jgi:hypothetical protein
MVSRVRRVWTAARSDKNLGNSLDLAYSRLMHPRTDSTEGTSEGSHEPVDVRLHIAKGSV